MQLVNLLKERGETLATAESLTGGLIAAEIVSVPGASEVFMGGIVSYTDEVKHRILGVKRRTLLAHTAVSAPVAEEMARGAAKRLRTTLAVAATGIAGPGGGTEETPVGCVYIGISHKGKTRAVRLSLAGDRDEIRRETVKAALAELEKELFYP